MKPTRVEVRCLLDDLMDAGHVVGVYEGVIAALEKWGQPEIRQVPPTDQDAKRWQTLVKALDQNHLKGPGYGDRVRVVMTSPMFGFEERMTATELQIRLDAIIKEEIMSTKTIENITFIKGNKAETLTDNEIFSEIAKLEAQKATLNKIENKPKKLEAAIVNLQDDIQALVDYVDGR